MENVLRKRIILKNSKDFNSLSSLKQGELAINYLENADKPTLKVGPLGADGTPGAAVEVYAKCSEIANTTNGLKISETEESTFGGMVSTSNGIEAKEQSLNGLGKVSFTEGLSYGSSLPSQGYEGQVFFLITDSNSNN